MFAAAAAAEATAAAATVTATNTAEVDLIQRSARHVLGAQNKAPARQLHQAEPSAEDMQQALLRMRAVPFNTPRPVLALGYKGLEADALRNWHLLARKLATPGATVTVVAFGGSLTAGYIDKPEAWKRAMDGSWVEPMVAWMKAAFPAVSFRLINAARGASEVTVAATCWYQYVPQDADLVLVEYSLNGCLEATGQPMCSSTAMVRVAAYESFYRRVLRRAPRTALMSVATFSFNSDTYRQGLASVEAPNAFAATGEELHTMIARRYGAPTASLRDSLYGLMYNDAVAKQLLGETRATIITDNVHPTADGFIMFGEIMAYTVRQSLAAVMASGAEAPGALGAAAAADGSGLPLPVSPVAAQQDADTWCREGSSFKPVASCTGRGSCRWETLPWHLDCPHDNCHMRGYLMKGSGAVLSISVDTSLAAAAGDAAAEDNDSTTGTMDSAAATLASAAGLLPAASDSSARDRSRAALQQFDRRYLAVTYVQGSSNPAETMAVATVACVSGCRCKPVQIEWRKTTNTGMAATEVSAHPRCVVSVTIQANATTGGDDFAVTGVAVVPFTKKVTINRIDGRHMAAVRAEGDQLPFSWP
uniref:SGNH hydrolase-type esterase domain-containing protein n=1 Tax=Tetradesmus obliquus TaxID=3088 RepID=A0A383VXD9_TETOB|eukprot:jgi/Sobl393_1/17646/SZX69529.1